MKGKNTFCGILICVALACNGQKLWEKVYSEREFELSIYYSSSIVGDSMIIFTVMHSAHYCGGNFMAAVSTGGKEKWLVKDRYYDGDCGYIYCSAYYSRIFHLGDYIYGVGRAVFGDIAAPKVSISVFKWNLEGEEIFHKWYHNENWYYSQLFNPDYLDANEEGLLVTGANEIIKFDLEGDFVWGNQYDFIVEKAIFIHNSQLAFFSDNKLFISSSEGEISQELDFQVKIIDVIYASNQLFVLDASGVYIVDIETWQLTPLYLLEPGGGTLKQLKLFENELWLLRQSEENTILANLSGEEQLMYEFSISPMNISDFYVTNNEIFFLGESLQRQMALVAFGREEKKPDLTFPDIEFVDIEISNTTFRQLGHPPMGNEPFIAEYDARITIRNNGDETIESIGIFDQRSYIWTCGKHPFYQFFNQFTLHPNQDITIDLERSNEFSYNNTLIVCYQLLAPSSRLEFNIGNNGMCKTFDFTSVFENEFYNAWKIHPNPATHHLTLEAPGSTPFRYQLFSIEGRMLLSGESADRTLRLDISDIPAGMYFVRLQQNNDSKTLKFLRQ